MACAEHARFEHGLLKRAALIVGMGVPSVSALCNCGAIFEEARGHIQSDLRGWKRKEVDLLQLAAGAAAGAGRAASGGDLGVVAGS